MIILRLVEIPVTHTNILSSIKKNSVFSSFSVTLVTSLLGSGKKKEREVRKPPSLKLLFENSLKWEKLPGTVPIVTVCSPFSKGPSYTGSFKYGHRSLNLREDPKW